MAVFHPLSRAQIKLIAGIQLACLQQHLENPLAQKILAGEPEAGSTIKADVKDGEFVFA